MVKSTKRILALLLCLAFVFTFSACKTTTTEDTSKDTSGTTSEAVVVAADVPADRRDASARTGNNKETPLVLSSGTMDGKFNPFYATSQYDVDVTNMTQLTLITNSATAEPVAGIDEPTFALSYTMTVSEDKSTSTYEFILKNGIKFSDGTAVTGKDVLFNLYEYLDPKYTGSSTLFSMDIKGLEAYRKQTIDPNDLEAMATENETKAAAAVAAYLAGTEITEEETTAIWEAVSSCIAEDAGALAQYGYTPADLGLEAPDDYADNYSATLILMYSGGLTYSAETSAWTVAEVTGLDVAKLADYTTDEYIAASLAYVKSTMTAAEYDDAFGYETVTGAAEKALSALVKSYEATYIEENKGTVKSISGITLDTVTDDSGVERERLTVVLNGVDPKAIWNFSFQVAPMAYYSTTELAAAADGTENFGVDFASTEFQTQLKQKQVPMGAGPYIAANNAGDKATERDAFWSNGIAYFVANDNYCLAAPLVKYLRYKTISLGNELTALQAGEVHYSDPHANTENINAIAGSELKHILVDNLGYGYIGINAQIISDGNARKALASAFDTALTLESYSGGLATCIYRSMSKVSWAYPTDAENAYPFDETGATSKAYFLASENYKEVGGKIVNADGSEVAFTFVLPSAASDHPAGAVFLKAQTVLAQIGVKVTIETDENVLSKLEDNVVAVWAAAWQATIDPDIYQVYYSDPAENSSGSPKSFGLYWMYENGTDEEKAALTELNTLINQARESLNVDERKPVYSDALDILTTLCVEIPTYQRKNMFVYNSDVIDTDSLYDNITPYRGPLFEIWDVSLAD